VKSIQPGLDDLAGLGAQTVTVGSAATVEILAAGRGIADGVDELASTVQTCPQATITSPDIGTADVNFAALDMPDPRRRVGRPGSDAVRDRSRRAAGDRAAAAGHGA
jgi:hypothetical protein